MNRTETPWLIVLMHCPMYSSYVHHYMEGETMRVMYEPWFVEYKVDVVFAGHVHAYERSVSSYLFVRAVSQLAISSISANLFFPGRLLHKQLDSDTTGTMR